VFARASLSECVLVRVCVFVCVCVAVCVCVFLFVCARACVTLTLGTLAGSVFTPYSICRRFIYKGDAITHAHGTDPSVALGA